MTPQLDLSSLSGGMLVMLGILVALQLALVVVCLVDLLRRPRERVTFENKWVWAAIIVFINLIGAIVYLALGRRPAPAATEESAESGGPSASSVADSLYGTAGVSRADARFRAPMRARSKESARDTRDGAPEDDRPSE